MLCDIHYHTDGDLPAERIVKHFSRLKQANGVDKICLLSIPVSTSSGAYRLENLRVLKIKDMLYPYAFAYMGFYHGEEKKDYLTQLKTGLAEGFEGVKILETKPDTQKNHGVRMCDESFDAAYNYAEANGVPVLMHVADPPESWDIEKVDKWAYEHGRFYGLPGFLTREELYCDVEKILKKHPDLKITFAHFYFMSLEIERAEKLFEKYKNISFDVTPGKEMYSNFGKDYKKARDFFIKYADRIYYGTDTNDKSDDEKTFNYQCKLNQLVSRNLTDTEDFLGLGYIDCKPLNLPEEVVEKIKSENFEKLLGITPKPVCYAKVKEEIAEIEAISHTLSETDKAVLQEVKEYFMSK